MVKKNNNIVSKLIKSVFGVSPYSKNNLSYGLHEKLTSAP